MYGKLECNKENNCDKKQNFQNEKKMFKRKITDKDEGHTSKRKLVVHSQSKKPAIFTQII